MSNVIVGLSRAARRERPWIEGWYAECGAIVSGRRTFDIAGGWQHGHQIDVPIFVVTHDPPAHGSGPITLEQTNAVASNGVTHIRYRVVR